MYSTPVLNVVTGVAFENMNKSQIVIGVRETNNNWIRDSFKLLKNRCNTTIPAKNIPDGCRAVAAEQQSVKNNSLFFVGFSVILMRV